MIIEAVIISLLILFFSGKKINESIEFKSFGLLFCVLGVGLSLINFIFTINDFGQITLFFVKNYYFSHLLALLLIIIGLLINYELPGLILIAAGFFANFLVIALNGKMPVDNSSLLSINNPEKYFIISQKLSLSHGIFDNPKLRILSDIIAIKPPYPFARVISVGDIIISIGIIIYIYNLKEQKWTYLTI